MPYLFCEEHGREQEARCEQEQESYRWLGETVLIVSGPMKSPSWQCALCHTRLRRGQRAWLVTAFPRPPVEGMDAYEYAAEREYLVLEHAEARLYGAEPPGGIPSNGHIRLSGVEAVELGGFDDGADGGGASAAAVGTGIS